jgi:fructose-1,6-bisphosphatase/sedoheptulose 1,7-bisphosphatase-like protein
MAPGTGVRVLADALALDLGVRNFEVYLSTARPRALAVEPGDPPAVIVGSEIAALGAGAVRFAFGHALRLVGTNFDLLAQGGAAEAGVLLAGIVRQFVPEFHHPELTEGEVQASSTRVARAMPKALRAELAPYAAEIATPLAVEAFQVAVKETAARIGLLASGDLAASLSVLCAVAGQPLSPATVMALPVATALVDFALSEEHEQLVAALDSVS